MPGFKKGLMTFYSVSLAKCLLAFPYFFLELHLDIFTTQCLKGCFFLFKFEWICYGNLQVTTPDSLQPSWLENQGKFNFSLHGRCFMPFTHISSPRAAMPFLNWLCLLQSCSPVFNSSKALIQCFVALTVFCMILV